MKIAVVIPKYGLMGGAEGFAYELTERLAARSGFEMHVFANKWCPGNPSIAFHKVPILAFPRLLRQIGFAYFSSKLIRLTDYDIIHSHDRIFRMDLFTMHGIPHKTWITEVRRKPLSLFDRSMAWVEEKALNGSRVPLVLPVSSLVKDELLRVYDIPEPKIRVIHPGVSTDRFSGLNKDMCRREIRELHGLSPNDIIVLFVGMNFEVKRLELILGSIAGLVGKRNRNSAMKLLVVGKGREGRYRSLARDLGIVNRVVFAGVTNEVEKYYLASDIFAMPSAFDTFGLAVLEAMAAGLPVIITRTVGARDLIDPGVHGFILPENPSLSDMTEVLTTLIQPEMRKKMGENSRKAALKHDWDIVANKVANIYLAHGNNKELR